MAGAQIQESWRLAHITGPTTQQRRTTYDSKKGDLMKSEQFLKHILSCWRLGENRSYRMATTEERERSACTFTPMICFRGQML